MLDDGDDYERKVLALIAEAVQGKLKAPLAPEMRLQRDLGIDSIGMLALLFRFEKTFGIDLASVDVNVTLRQMRTVGDALAVGREVLARAAHV
jgi:acyl carrier protein